MLATIVASVEVPMDQPLEHVLVADVGGTNTGAAIFAHHGGSSFGPVAHETYSSRQIRNFPSLLGKFLKENSRRLDPPVRKACIDFAGPTEPKRSKALITNLSWGFTAEEVLSATRLQEVTLVNDFEAVAYGLGVLIASRPEAFVRLSRSGKLPDLRKPLATAVVIGAGTGLGTAVLVYDDKSRQYRPVPGEGGHTDFGAVEKVEFEVAQWLRQHVNHSARQPLDREKIVSGRGLANVFWALSELEPESGDRQLVRQILAQEAYDRPPMIVANAATDSLCRKTLDVWLRCYARTAKNSVIFPLCPGGLFLAGGVAAKILAELQAGAFMREFTRCDDPNIRSILMRTPVFVIADYRVGLYGCANVAVNFSRELGRRR
jgi:glucokinase